MQEGTSNYFKGLMLILCYLIVAASFFVHVDPLDGELHIFPQMRERILSFPHQVSEKTCFVALGCR